MCIRSLIGILAFFVAASVQGQMLPDREVEALWQDFQATQSDQSQSRHADVDEYSELLKAAARIQAEAEQGLRELSQRDFERLQAILHQPVPEVWDSKSQQSVSRLESVRTTGEISGVVLETGTGIPLTSGVVRAMPFGEFLVSDSVNIQSDGTYSITLDPGHYVLQTDLTPEHIAQAWPGIECVNAIVCSPWYGGEVIEVDTGDDLTHNFTVERGVRVEGVVTDASGNPVADARVRVSSRNRSVSTSAITEGDGSYITSALPSGEYRIYVEPTDDNPGLVGRLHDGQLCQSACGDLPVSFETLSDVNTPETFDFDAASGLHLDSGFGLSGQVFDEDGTTPLENAFVSLLSTDDFTSVTAGTDEFGEYSFDALREADYVIIVGHRERLGLVHPDVECFGSGCTPEVGDPVTLGGSAETLDFSLSTGATISGQILRESDGMPLEGIDVWAGNSLQGAHGTVTDASGEFTVEGLPAGTFYVTASPGINSDPDDQSLQRTSLGNVNCPARSCGDFGQPINVEASDTVTGLTISMPEGGGISGEIFDAETGLPMGFAFVSRLELWVASGPYEGELAAQPIAQADGTYRVDGLMPGAYKATFGTSTHLGLIDTAFGGQPCPRGSCDHDDLPTVFVTAGAVLPDIDATLPRGPIISGQVLNDNTGQPQPPPVVGSGLPPIIAFYGTSGNYASFSEIDGEGRYRSRTGFPVGTFFASTFSVRGKSGFGDNMIDQAYDGLDCPRLKCNLTASATAIDVVDSDIDGIDFSLRQGGGISGTVSDVDDATPLSGIGLEIYDGAGRLVANTVTDALGNYSVDALPSGSYTLRTRNSRGYQDQLHDGILCTPFCNPVNGTQLSVTEGDVVSGIDFDLVQSVAISGTVTVDGIPAENITVAVYGAVGNFIAETMSGSDGSYAFTSLAPGEFYLRTRNTFGHADTLYQDRPCVGNACRVRRGDRIELDPGQEQTGVDLNLMPGAIISGEAHDRMDTETKLSGVTVQLLTDRGAVAFEQTTGSSGQFSFSSLPAGDYHLVTRRTPAYIDQTLGGQPCSSVCGGLGGDVIQLGTGQTDTGNDMDLAPGASISGSVQAGGSPAVGAQAQVYNDAGAPVSRQPTNASGNYEIKNLPDGDFHVRVTGVPGHVSELYNGIACSGFCDILNGDVVPIVDNTDVGQIDFSLPAGGAIAGVVTSDGSALPGVEVVAFDSAGFIAGRAVTNASGQYTVQGLVDGDYRLRTTNVGGFVDEVYGGDSCSPSACDIGDGDKITVSGATVSGIDFSLDAGTSIAGTATDWFGNPLPDGTAVLLDADGFEITTAVISDGLWSFDGLADGTYYLLIENNLGLVDELFDDVPCPGGSCDITGLGTPITIGGGGSGDTLAGIRSGGVADIAVVLGEGSAISGKVTDADSGEPLVDVVVYFFDQAGNLVGSSEPTDGLGEYESGGGLPEGTYFAATASGTQRGAGDNYVNGLYDGEICLLDCDVTAGTAIEVGAGEVDGVDFALSQGAGLSGRVTGPEGGLVQVEVRVFDSDGFLAGTAKTDSQGRYEIDGLIAGDYFAHTVNDQDLGDVTFGDAPCLDECEPLEGDSFAVGSTGLTEDIDFQLDLPDEVFTDRFEE